MNATQNSLSFTSACWECFNIIFIVLVLSFLHETLCEHFPQFLEEKFIAFLHKRKWKTCQKSMRNSKHDGANSHTIWIIQIYLLWAERKSLRSRKLFRIYAIKNNSITRLLFQSHTFLHVYKTFIKQKPLCMNRVYEISSSLGTVHKLRNVFYKCTYLFIWMDVMFSVYTDVPDVSQGSGLKSSPPNARRYVIYKRSHRSFP